MDSSTVWRGGFGKAIGFCLWVFLLVLRAAASDLGAFQEYLQAQEVLLERQHGEKREDLNRMYIGSISNLVTNAVASGDLARVLWLRETVEAFEKSGPELRGPPASEDADFARVQNTWERLERDLRREHGGKMLVMLQRYDDALAQLQIRLTREGRIEEALQVQEERKKRAEDPRREEWTALQAEVESPAEDAAAAEGPLLPVLTAFNASLVLYFPFDREERGRIMDRSRGRNHAQATALGWEAQGPRGGAAIFDGDTSALVIPNSKSLQITGSQTLAFWIRPARRVGRTNPINKAYGGEYTLTLEINGDVNYYHGTFGGDNQPYQGFRMPQALKEGEWVHLAVVRDVEAGKLTWYRNGKPVATEKAAYPAATASDRAVTIGQGYAGKFKGALDEIMLFHQALGPVDIQRIYRSVGGR